MRSKFSNIQFPIYCLSKKPYDYYFKRDKVWIKLFKNDIEDVLIDDLSVPINNYVFRLEHLKKIRDDVVYYDYKLEYLNHLLRHLQYRFNR